jgi:2-keto-4-pentenoate hydratase
VNARLDAEAVALARAARTRRPIAPLTQRLPGLSVADAYAIQRAGIARRLVDGARIVGHKVGLTSRAMQQQLGVDRPDYGVLLDDMIVEENDGLNMGRLVAPRVEAEIAFDLAKPLRGPEVDIDQVLEATSTVRAALEVIDSRIADWQITFEDTIADNASSALVVLGPPVAVDGIDLVAEHVTLTVGTGTVSGNGEAVLGHPAQGVAWLARTLADHGEGLRAGDLILPGAMAAAIPIARGDIVNAAWTSLGQLQVPVR